MMNAVMSCGLDTQVMLDTDEHGIRVSRQGHPDCGAPLTDIPQLILLLRTIYEDYVPRPAQRAVPAPETGPAHG